jgi:hypothetical protein
LAAGLAVGGGLFYRTPEGQSPFEWVRGAALWVFRPNRSFWQPLPQEAGPSVWIERWQSTGTTRTRSGETTGSDSATILGQRNTTQTLDFEHIRDDGVVITATGYARIIEIDPTPWLILDEASRESTIDAFERYLAGVGSSIQFLTLPVPFDVDQHCSALATCRSNGEADSPVLTTGRDRHAQWLDRLVSRREIRDRRHFLVVSIPRESGDQGPASTSDSTGSFGNEVVEELDARTENARSSLPRSGVSTSVLTARESVLEVLYRYYRGQSPPEGMDHGWLTRRGSGEGES